MAELFHRQGQSYRQPSATQVLPETTWVDETSTGVPPVDTIVVTITRQFGSGGADVARLVAQKSRLQYVDSQIIDEVARRLGVNTEQASRLDEQTSGNARHILAAMQASQLFPINYSTLLGATTVTAHSRELAYLRLTQKVILEIATQGNAIIVGRGSQFLLHGSPRILHAYVFAPLPYRIENVMNEFHLGHNEAERLIKQRDYEQDNYSRHYYGSDGHQPGLYHLLINTGLFPFELAADLILQALPIVKELGN